MKRIFVVTMAAMLVLSIAGPALAVDLAVKGEWDFAFGWSGNRNFRDHHNRNGGDPDHFIARQRFRTQIDFIASEQLKGVLMFEIGDIDWGRDEGKNGPGSGGGLDSDGVNVETKLAYLDWMIPETDIHIRMGIQEVALPSATGFGNPVLNSDVAGIVASMPINDMFSIIALWVRPFDRYDDDNNDDWGRSRNLADEMDMFALAMPITGEGWAVTPWSAYSRMGSASGALEYVTDYNSYMNDRDMEIRGGDTAANVWWAGLGFELAMFEPLTFAMDAMYGHMSRVSFDLVDWGQGRIYGENVGTSGWFIDASLNYQLDWGTPGIFGWWSSGDGENAIDSGKYGRMPAIGFDNGFAPSTFGTPGGFSIGTDTVLSATALGTWGIGLQIADMSFIEDLTHTVRAIYYRGTNDHELVENKGIQPLPLSGEVIYLTDKDWALEINFDHSYQIYENLSAHIEAGYIRLKLDEDIWDNVDGYDGTKDAWKAQLLFQYKF